MKTLAPVMGRYFYTACGRAAYVAFCDGGCMVLPLAPRNPLPAHAMGFVWDIEGIVSWDVSGIALVHYRRGLNLAEPITMEAAFQYPQRKMRPVYPVAVQGDLL